MNPMWSEDYTEPMIRGDEVGGWVNPKWSENYTEPMIRGDEVGG